jgi:hypothetical protein
MDSELGKFNFGRYSWNMPLLKSQNVLFTASSFALRLLLPGRAD